MRANKRVIVGTAKPDTYLVTKDVALTLQNRYRLDLNPIQRKAIRDLENQFLEEFWPLVPAGSKTVSIDAEDLQRGLTALIAVERLPVITLDEVYISPNNPYVNGALSVTRLTDSETKQIIGLKPRPGAAPLEEQINGLSCYKSICLVDIGAFEGGTLIDIVRMLRGAGIEVERAYLGVWGKQAIDAVNGAVDARALKTFDFYEWIEGRDFFGIDGRKMSDGGFIPLSEYAAEWASIAPENAGAVRELGRKYKPLLSDLLGGAI